MSQNFPVRRFLGDLAVAWHVAPVRWGLLGTLLIALGSLSPAYLPHASPLWRWLSPLGANGTAWRVVGTILTMIGALLLVDAWFRLRPQGLVDESAPPRALRAHLRHWWHSINSGPPPMADKSSPLACRGPAALFWWSLPLLVAPPVFSQDAYSYAAQGWIVHNHLDPYAVGPGMLPGAFADQVASEWRMTPAPYGPLSLQISDWLVVATRYTPYLAAWAHRLPALLGVALIGFFLPRIARRMGLDENLAVWFGLLNPMLVISFIGGAHNDALMMGCVVAALWLTGLGRRHQSPATSWWWLAGAVAVGVGAAVKQPALMTALALPLMLRPWASLAWRESLIAVARILTSLGVSAATFVAITLATRLSFGWVNAVSVPGRSVTVAPFTLAGLAIQHIAAWLGVSLDQAHTLAVARLVGIVVGVILLAFLGLTLARRQPIAFLAWGYLTAALCGPAMRTWYAQWSVTLVPLTRMSSNMVRLSVWGILVMFGFDAMYMSMRNSAVAVCVGALLAMAWVAWRHLPPIARRKA